MQCIHFTNEVPSYLLDILHLLKYYLKIVLVLHGMRGMV